MPWRRIVTRISNWHDIPASVTTIDKYAFSYAGITEVTIPSGVTRIEEQTFANCRKLRKATLPDGITYIGNSAFSECHALEDVNIPANIETIDQYAFYNNKVRTSPIVLPATLKSIGYRAFMYNSKVERITFSEGLETISGYAFSSSPLYCQKALQNWSITPLRVAILLQSSVFLPILSRCLMVSSTIATN